MEDSSQANKLNRLRLVVVVLACACLALAAALFLRPKGEVSGVQPALPSGTTVVDSWAGLSLEEKLGRASALVVVELSPKNGKLVAIARDVVVLKPGTRVNYTVGQEVTALSRPAGGTTDWGDGAVGLLEGSPASVRESYSVRAGRVTGLGDIAVEELRRTARAR